MAILCFVLIAVILVQIGKVTELAAKLRGEARAARDSNNMNANFMVVFVALFLILCVATAVYYKNSMLGYGPHESASEHGILLDRIFNITTGVCSIVFFITQILLFWFAYKFRERDNSVGLFMPHDNKLEIIWTAIPAVVMTFLVIGGLDAWNEVMADVDPGEEYIEIEATGMQFAWIMRYPGADGLLGERDYKLITPTNQLGQNWDDVKNHDDIVTSAPGEVIKLPKGRQIRVRITARDVLHNFDLPHFRVKMDAIPGLPTYFVFTPRMTTEEYRANLATLDKTTGEPLYPEWYDPEDESEPDGPKRWEAFNFELACAELCGNGHYSMRRIIEIVEEDVWVDWMEDQKPFYVDPNEATETVEAVTGTEIEEISASQSN